ncbi:hypothetical protein FVE85_8523 [Porphyridium purpureum]|uniref:Uncharacterized protein n=1 Tax=Porphyridium purpureum TaxID=35688 RepID=A0A5J4YHP0_PORPP|nr:hypothetical protein FVE85_8523 [Porphyridium purpureum]|eukprot:POR1001..scf257_31
MSAHLALGFELPAAAQRNAPLHQVPNSPCSRSASHEGLEQLHRTQPETLRDDRASASREHVTIWNRLEKRKIAGNASPLSKNVDRYLKAHPDCEVYSGQDLDSGRKLRTYVRARSGMLSREKHAAGLIPQSVQHTIRKRASAGIATSSQPSALGLAHRNSQGGIPGRDSASNEIRQSGTLSSSSSLSGSASRLDGTPAGSSSTSSCPSSFANGHCDEALPATRESFAPDSDMCSQERKAQLSSTKCDLWPSADAAFRQGSHGACSTSASTALRGGAMVIDDDSVLAFHSASESPHREPELVFCFAYDSRGANELSGTAEADDGWSSAMASNPGPVSEESLTIESIEYQPFLMDQGLSLPTLHTGGVELNIS